MTIKSKLKLIFFIKIKIKNINTKITNKMEWEYYSSYDMHSTNDGKHSIEINKYNPNTKFYYWVSFNAYGHQVAVGKSNKKTILAEESVFKTQKLIVDWYQHKVKLVDKCYIVDEYAGEREIIKDPIVINAEYGATYTLTTRVFV
jgi:hypothetical protein